MSESFTREAMHLRSIDLRGYRRSDGLFEVEGHVVDRKTHTFAHQFPGKTVPALEPIHDMGIRVVFDETMTVLEIHSFTTDAPYRVCFDGGEELQRIKGLRMAGGWSREVKARLGRSVCCTHLMELLIPMATAAHQTLGFRRVAEPDRLDANGTPLQIDSCYAYAAQREVVLQRWPRFYREPEGTEPHE